MFICWLLQSMTLLSCCVLGVFLVSDLSSTSVLDDTMPIDLKRND